MIFKGILLLFWALIQAGMVAGKTEDVRFGFMMGSLFSVVLPWLVFMSMEW